MKKQLLSKYVRIIFYFIVFLLCTPTTGIILADWGYFLMVIAFIIVPLELIYRGINKANNALNVILKKDKE